MALPTGLRTLVEDYRYQLRLKGSLPARLAYATLYWSLYLSGRLLGRDWGRAHGDAMDRLGAWGLNSRVVRVSLPGGPRLTLDQLTARMILRELWADDVYEMGEGRAFAPRPGETVFDVGAQQGVYSLLAAARGAKVFAFEPEPGNRGRLSANVAANGAPVTVLDCALGAAPGAARLHRSAGNTGGHSLTAFAGATDAVEVRVSTLDAACAELGAAPSLLKIDVEGHAPEVLAGAIETLRRHRPRLAMELENPGDREKAAALLVPLGYRLRSGPGSIAFASPEAA